jgi:F-type H+-transporting ATPase subunit a
MHEEHGFTWLSLIPGLDHAPNHVVMAILLCGLLILCTFVARMQLSRLMRSGDAALVPEPKLTFRNFFEIIAESLYKLTENVIGHHDAPKFYPVVGALFVFIFASNIVGLIPGVRPPTDDRNTTFALGLFVFLYYNYVGLKTNGLAYIKHFFGPMIWLAPLMFIIEVFSHVFRPLSLGLRLWGNIYGDHIILGVFLQNTPWFVPVIFYGLGVFVSFIQAFVFCLMTMVYISLSTAHDH